MKVFLLLAAIALIMLYWRKIQEDLILLKTQPKIWLRDKWKEWGEPLVVAGILAIAIRTFIVGPYKIPTGSMRPTLMEGDRIFVDKITYRFREPKRGEIIVFKYPLDIKKDFVKRLVAFGGETVEIRDGNVYINGERVESPASVRGRYYYNRNDWDYGREGEQIKIPDGSFFVLGDNSAQSSDSRNWGFVPRKDLVGRAVVIWWPPKRIGSTK